MIPQLKDFGISDKTGFMPEQEPLKRLPKEYEPWEQIVDDIGHLLISLLLRERVEALRELSVEGLDQHQLQRAYLVLCLLSHAYVWGSKGQVVMQKLPRNLAVPWIRVSVKLGIRPISCHAALVYYNWKFLDPSQGLQLSNLATLHTISGGIDESWFYLITMAIEAVGARSLQQITLSLESLVSDDYKTLAGSLKEIAGAISDMTAMLKRMNENCDPYIFYHRVRIYFSGWTNNLKDLPNGLVYEGDQGEVEQMFIKEGHFVDSFVHGKGKLYPGGSAAQSPLIHAIDVFLGVEHQPTKNGDGVNFLKEMRYHMPGKFRAYLTALEQAPNLRQTLQKGKPDKVSQADYQTALNAYNDCVTNIKIFRDVHIQIVTRYIIMQAKRAKQTGQLQAEGEGYGGMGANANKVIRLASGQDALLQNDGLSPEPKANGDEVHLTLTDGSQSNRGTGGTDIIPFLKQSRDETKSTLL